MDLLRLDGPLDETIVDPFLVLALDGWTDAGRAGSLAGEAIKVRWQGTLIGTFDPDRLFDYRDRRPILQIDRGLLGDPVWPSLDLYQLTAPDGTAILMLQGNEPDLGWRSLCADVRELAELTGATRYVGLGAVPAPVPHTRATRVITTGSDEAILERYGRPHEQLTVPASCQVVVESALRDAGLTTLGLWAQVPHYVAGEYPAAAQALLAHLAGRLEVDIESEELQREADEHRDRLDLAAESSEDVTAHIRQLEQTYDTAADGGAAFGRIPSGDEIAAEFERFLRGREGGGG